MIFVSILLVFNETYSLYLDNPQAVQHHPMIQTGYTNVPGQMTALPQVFTNSAGQLVTLGPQVWWSAINLFNFLCV